MKKDEFSVVGSATEVVESATDKEGIVALTPSEMGWVSGGCLAVAFA